MYDAAYGQNFYLVIIREQHGVGEDFDRLRVSCHHHKLRVLVAGENRKRRLKIIGTEISRTDQSTQLGTGHLQGRTMN